MNKQLLCLFFLFLSGCDDSSSYSRNEDTSATTKSLESIQISLGNHLKGRSDIIVHNSDEQEFIAIGTFSDGTQKEITETVSWLYSPEHLVQKHEFGNFTFIHEGLLTLNASLSDVTSNELEVEITPAELTAIQLTPSESEVPIGKKVQMKAIGSYSDDTTLELDLTGSAEWTSKNPNIASVNSLGVVTPISEGSTVIIVSKGDKKTETTKFVVTSAVLEELKLEPLSVETPMGKNITMTVKARYSGNDQLEELELNDLTWASTNEHVATVINGVVTPKSVGDTTIKVMKDGKNVETTRFTVTSAILESIQIRGDIEAPVGSITELTAIGTYSDNNVVQELTEASWTSNDTNIATVVNGSVTPKSAGVTEITVTKDAKEASIEFTVTEVALASISLTPASSSAIDVSIRKNITMQAKGIYTNQAELPLTDGAWTSSDESVATVVDGVVAPISMGEVTIKVIKDHKEASQLFSVTSDKYPCNGEEGNYDCLPIVESKTQKGLYFTSTPDKSFSEQYGFGDASFYSDADGFQGLMLPPYIAESGSVSWCKELNKITYGGRSNWVASTSSQLSQLYSDYGNMFDKFGWPIGVEYDGSSSDGGKLINLATGEVDDPVFLNSYYTSCSSLPL